MAAPGRRTAPARRQRDTNGDLMTSHALRERAESAARRRESERATYDAWQAGQAVPYRITLALNKCGLYGPEVDEACGVKEPAVDQWEEGILYPTWEQLYMTDYTRYEPGNDGVGRLAIFCTDCGTETNDVAIWTEDDAAEQVTPVTLANWIAHADEHEEQQHAPVPLCEACGKAPGTYGGSPGDGNLCSPCYDTAIHDELAWDGEAS